MKATNIEWDVDYQEDLEDLPTEIEIPEGMEDEEEISDYLSDVTGFCHKGYQLVETEKISLDSLVESATTRAANNAYHAKQSEETMEWFYGEKIFHEFPELRHKWSNDLEVGLKVADRYFDYLWDISENGEIVLTDRLYSDGISDRLVGERVSAEVLVLHFKDPDELFSHFLPHMKAIAASKDPEFIAAVEYMERRDFQSVSARDSEIHPVSHVKEKESETGRR